MDLPDYLQGKTMHLKPVISLFLIPVFSFFLVACANNQPATTKAIKQQSAEAAKQPGFTPEEAIRKAEAMLGKALEAELDFYAPLHLEQAKDSLSDAREFRENPPKDIANAALMSAIASQNFIQKGYENKALVKRTLDDALTHLDVLTRLNAQSLLEQDYQDVYDELVSIVASLERGELAAAVEDQKQLLENMSRVEIDTLKLIHLSDAEQWLEKAEDIDADDFAAQTYQRAEQTLAAADQFIEDSYRDRTGVEKVGDRALLASKQAYFTGYESKNLLALTAEDAEQKALELIAFFNKIARKTDEGVLPPQTLSDSADALSIRVGTVSETNKILKEQLETAEKKPEADGEESNITPNGNQDEEAVKVIKVLPGFEQQSDNAPELAPDEQGFDSIETME